MAKNLSAVLDSEIKAYEREAPAFTQPIQKFLRKHAEALISSVVQKVIGEKPTHRTLIEQFMRAQIREGAMNVTSKRLEEVADMSPIKRLLTVPATVRKAAATFDELRRTDPKELGYVDFEKFDENSRRHARNAPGIAKIMASKGLSL